jgi:hypothetical protein
MVTKRKNAIDTAPITARHVAIVLIDITAKIVVATATRDRLQGQYDRRLTRISIDTLNAESPVPGMSNEQVRKLAIKDTCAKDCRFLRLEKRLEKASRALTELESTQTNYRLIAQLMIKRG